MLTPKPTQISGAHFLAQRRNALLADLPRVGKTGSAILAADDIMAEQVLTITTASGRGVWKSGWANWSPYPRRTQIIDSASDKLDPRASNIVVGWTGITNPTIRTALLRRNFDLVIPDEAHNAKNFETKRTQSLYGTLDEDGTRLLVSTALISRASRVWPLTGTPLPNNPLEAYPMMRALCPERLRASEELGSPDVTRYSDFVMRYAKMRPHKISRWRSIQVFVEGRNLDELRARLAGFFLQRTQKDVGILEPEHEIMPLIVSDRMLREAEGDLKHSQILAAATAGSTRDLEMHLGPLRRLTGEIMARAIVPVVKEEFTNGLGKLVLAYWHKDVGKILAEGLHQFGVAQIDGETNPKLRPVIAETFQTDPSCRVFLAQIQAAGEAIDLSASSQLWFVESSFVPKDMKQMSLRITNHTQKRQPLVRVCVLQGSIYEALQTILLRKWSAIREVLAA